MRCEVCGLPVWRQVGSVGQLFDQLFQSPPVELTLKVAGGRAMEWLARLVPGSPLLFVHRGL